MKKGLDLLLKYKVTQILVSQKRCGSSRNRCFSTNFLKVHERGLFSDIFPNQPQRMVDAMNSGPQTVYAGFDPTADSLHIGNLLVLINLMHWQRCGHNVVALVGGATAMIGDPSGKLTERPKAELMIVERNLQCLKNNITKLFENHQEFFCKDFTPNPVVIHNNMEWYSTMSSIHLISKIGRHFRLGTMLSRQSVKDRLNSEEGMSFAEFTYQVFQANDWLHLYNKYNCRFQIGGNDQLGNMASGYELIKRITNKDVFGLTLPLIVTEEGDKFGKSAGNAVWLSKDKSSVFQFYQFFIRVKDSDVERMLKLFTFISLNEIQDLMKKHMKNPERRIAQIRLAELVTLLVHGVDGLERAKLASSVLYERDLNKLSKLETKDIYDLFKDSTSVELLLEPGLTVLDFAMKAKCFFNEKDAVRIITAGGFSINYQKVSNFNEVISKSTHILPNNISLVRVGKKNYTIVKWLL